MDLKNEKKKWKERPSIFTERKNLNLSQKISKLLAPFWNSITKLQRVTGYTTEFLRILGPNAKSQGVHLRQRI